MIGSGRRPPSHELLLLLVLLGLGLAFVASSIGFVGAAAVGSASAERRGAAPNGVEVTAITPVTVVVPRTQVVPVTVITFVRAEVTREVTRQVTREVTRVTPVTAVTVVRATPTPPPVIG